MADVREIVGQAQALADLQASIKGNKTAKVVTPENLATIELSEVGRTNTTGLGNGEVFEFLSKEEYAAYKENGSIQLVTSKTSSGRIYTRMYALVNAYYMTSDGTHTGEHKKFTDVSNMVKTEYISNIEPENGIVKDPSTPRRQTINDGGTNAELGELRTPYERLEWLAGKKIQGVLSEDKHLQQVFENRQPKPGEFEFRQITLPNEIQ